MLIDDLLDMKEVARQIGEGMLKTQHHPQEPFVIVSYTRMAPFTMEKWNSTTDLCRGIIYNARTRVILARPFVKFWNYSDSRHPESMPENFPASSPLITRKMDGSLGIGYIASDGYSVATRGSFMSEQAEWATKWIRTNSPCYWPEGYTPLFEIIYPENQIVVKYDYAGLVLLALIENETGEEVGYEKLKGWAETNNLQVVEMFDRPITECVEEDTPNEEGYVISWPRPGTHPLRCKVKHETYCRLHKLLTQTSAIGVWEMLRDGQDIGSLTVDVPADFSTWIRGIEAKLRGDFCKIEASAATVFQEYPGEKNITTVADKKAFALYALTKQPLTPILFAMVERKEYDKIIWKSLRPVGNQPFKVDE